MGLLAIYSKLKEVESRTGKLYSLVSAKIATSYPAISILFRKLADDEIMHEKEIEMSKKFFMENKEIFFGKEDAEQILDQIFNKIDTINKYFLEHLENLAPDKLLDMAANLEWEMESRHHSFYVNCNDEGIKNLMENLSNKDNAHKKLITYMSKTGKT